MLVTSDKGEIVDTLIQDCGAVNPTVSRQKKGGLIELRERGGGGTLVTTDKGEEIVDILIQDCCDVDPTVSRQKKGGLRELRERGGGGSDGHISQGDSEHPHTGLWRCQPHGE